MPPRTGGAARRRALLAALGLVFATGCVPYTVGTTARPVRTGDNTKSLVNFVMPSIGSVDSGRAMSGLASDWETRFGIDGKSDVGVRAPSWSGIVVNYKRLLSDDDSRALVAVMPGAGVVNLGQHGHFEMTLLVSRWEPSSNAPLPPGREAPKLVPYGGVRVMQVVPLAQGAVHDRPTAGVFFGARIGSLDLGVSPEIGVFHDHSALKLRKSSVVIVPAITLHGDRLISAIRRGLWR